MAQQASGAKHAIEDAIGDRRETIFLLVALGALLVALFHGPLFSGEAFYQFDLGDDYLPVQVENARQRASGIFPLWNPYLLFGYPVSAEPQSGGLYPLSLIFNLPLGHERAYALYIVAHLVVAALSMRFLAKQLGLSPTARCIAAMVFAFSGAFIVQIINLPLVTTIAWAPLLLALHHRSIVTRSVRPALLAGAVLGISLLGAHPQMTLHSVLLCGLLVLFPPGEGTYRQRFQWGAGCLAVIVITGVAVASPQLIHTLAWLSEVDPAQAAGTGFEPPYQFLTSYSLPPHHLLQLVVPDLFGSGDAYIDASTWIEQRSYVGLAVVGLVVVGWQSAPRFYRVTLVAAVLLAFGRFIGVYHLLQYVPIFNMFRCPARFLLVATLACGVIAGFGYDSFHSWCARGRRGEIGVRVYVIASVLLVALGLALHHVASSPNSLAGDAWQAFSVLGSEFDSIEPSVIEATARVASRSALLAAVMAIATALWWSRARKGPGGLRGTVAIISLVAFDLWQASIGVHRYGAPDHYATTGRFADVEPGLARMYRVAPPEHEGDPTNYTNLGSLHRVHLVEAFLSREPRRLARFDLRADTMSLAKLAAGNVRYWWSTPPAPRALRGALVDRAAPRSDTAPEITYEIAAARSLDRTYLVDRHRIISDEVALFRWVNSSRFDPWTEVLLPRSPRWPADCADTREIEPAASIVRHEPNRVVIRARAPRCSILVLSDMFFPGWHATVDGRPADLLPANGLFRAVALGPGEHTVELRFWHRGLTPALVVSALVLLGALACGFFLRPRRRHTSDVTAVPPDRP